MSLRSKATFVGARLAVSLRSRPKATFVGARLVSVTPQ